MSERLWKDVLQCLFKRVYPDKDYYDYMHCNCPICGLVDACLLFLRVRRVSSNGFNLLTVQMDCDCGLEIDVRDDPDSALMNKRTVLDEVERVIEDYRVRSVTARLADDPFVEAQLFPYGEA